MNTLKRRFSARLAATVLLTITTATVTLSTNASVSSVSVPGIDYVHTATLNFGAASLLLSSTITTSEELATSFSITPIAPEDWTRANVEVEARLEIDNEARLADLLEAVRPQALTVSLRANTTWGALLRESRCVRWQLIFETPWCLTSFGTTLGEPPALRPSPLCCTRASGRRVFFGSTPKVDM
jgi:hypothetical protein